MKKNWVGGLRWWYSQCSACFASSRTCLILNSKHPSTKLARNDSTSLQSHHRAGRQEAPWGLLVSQPCQTSEFHVQHEILSKLRWKQSKKTSPIFWLSHAPIHTHTSTYTDLTFTHEHILIYILHTWAHLDILKIKNMAEKITKLGETYRDKDEISTESPQKIKSCQNLKT